ncbi:FecR domain-containing protein [Planctomycetales bacterium ZRK34]|nr:FecR domain-containing protein [Planctomycetales bacterium ZRK34]
MISRPDDTLNDLLEAARLNELSDVQFDQLHHRLRTDGEACSAYVEYMTLHAMLLWECPDRAAAIEAESTGESVTMPRPTYRLPRYAALVMAAMILLAASITGVMYMMPGDRPSPEPAVAYAAHNPVGVVIGGDNNAWQAGQGGAMLSPGQSVHAGQIAMDSGETEIELFGGVRLHFTGPVRANVIDAMRLSVQRGKVRATVPHGSVGFTIDAVGVRIVDLGTVFEVEVTENQVVDVSVLEGNVQTMMNVPDHDVYTMRLSSRSRVRIDPANATVSRFDPWELEFDAPMSTDWRPIDAKGAIHFVDSAMHPYADQDGFDQQPTAMEIADDGRALHLIGNAWKYLAFDYEVTPNTVVEFDFRGEHTGEMHGIAFDDDNRINSSQRRFFIVAGRLDHPQAFSDYKRPASSAWTHYRIAVGQHYQGPMKQLIFFADDDRDGQADSWFRNVRVYENEIVQKNETSEGATP